MFVMVMTTTKKKKHRIIFSVIGRKSHDSVFCIGSGRNTSMHVIFLRRLGRFFSVTE